MSDAFELKLTGIEAVARYLKRVDVKTRARIIKPALRRELRPLATEMRRTVPVRFGLLKRAIGIMMKSFRGGRIVWSRTGPRGGSRFAGAFIIGGRAVDGVIEGGRKVKADPRRYAHLVESDTKNTTAQPFMEPAFDTVGPQVVRRFSSSVGKQIERLAAKENKKP